MYKTTLHVFLYAGMERSSPTIQMRGAAGKGPSQSASQQIIFSDILFMFMFIQANNKSWQEKHVAKQWLATQQAIQHIVPSSLL